MSEARTIPAEAASHAWLRLSWLRPEIALLIGVLVMAG
jgi:hypothetical protein